MANDKVEFELTINGKQAKKSLQDIEKELGRLEKQDKETAKSMKLNWVAIGASVAATAAVVGKMSKSAMTLEKATFGLNKQTKEYIKNMSELHGMSQEVIAGFVQTGKAAGMSGNEIKTMVDQAIALGRKFPHESVESFVDNLTMLNRTGEAQGYIVDILEQKYGQVDLKLISTADKLKTVEEATRGVNAEFQKTGASKFDTASQKMTNAFTNMGTAFNNMLYQTGILTFFQYLGNQATKAFGYITVGIEGTSVAFKWMETQGKLAIANLLYAFRDIPAIGKKAEEASDGMFLSYNLANDELKQQEKNLKSLIVDQKKLNKTIEEGVLPKGKKPEKLDLGIAGFDDKKSNKELTKFKNKIAQLQAEMKTAVRDKRITPEEFLFGMDVINTWSTEVQGKITQGLSMEQAVKNSRKDLKTITDAVEDSSAEWASFGRGAVNTMSNAFTEWAMTGKMDVKAMAQSIIADLIRVMIQIQMVNAIRASGFGAFLGLHTGGEVKHTGGMIGGGSHIPSYHTGMRSDERMAKLQVGESVVNRAGTANNGAIIDAMNRGQKIGGGSNVVINIENNTGTPMTAEQSTSRSSSGGIETIIKNVTLKLASTDSQFRSMLAGAR